MFTPAQRAFINSAIALAQREIISLVIQGRVPQSVPDFATLHDYIDANELGGLCDGVPLPMFEFSDSMTCQHYTDACNEIQNAVSEWLECGVLAGLRHDYMVMIHTRLEKDEEEREYLAQHPQHQAPGFGLDKQQRAHVLAALKLFRIGVQYNNVADWLQRIATDSGSLSLMTKEEIDALCESINVRTV